MPMATNQPFSTSVSPPWSTATHAMRPLSDITEVTEPNLAEAAARAASLERKTSSSRKESLTRKTSLSRKASVGSSKAARAAVREGYSVTGPPSTPIVSPTGDNERTNTHDLPSVTVPPRASSQLRRTPAVRAPRTSSRSRTRGDASHDPAAARGHEYTVASRGAPTSPVKHAAAKSDSVSNDTARKMPSKTYVRPFQKRDMLENSEIRHDGVTLELQLRGSSYVGGGCIEGSIRVVIDHADRTRHNRSKQIARASIDLVGVEEVEGPKRATFLNLATDVIDPEHPPPLGMVDSRNFLSTSDRWWQLLPSNTTLPFILNLPAHVGPPTFTSKGARIRHVIIATMLVRDRGQELLVRTCEDVTLMSLHDPGKALQILPSPLTATDDITKPRGAGVEVVTVTAGIRRQVWICGNMVHVDVHIANNSKKRIKKLEMQVEQNILFYKHAAASTLEEYAGRSRLFDSNERTIVGTNIVKEGDHGWHGVAPSDSSIRACQMPVENGHATIRCGKFFEVRYFLNIIVHAFKPITIQLPIHLIHLESIDPNSRALDPSIPAAGVEDDALNLHNIIDDYIADSPVAGSHSVRPRTSQDRRRSTESARRWQNVAARATEADEVVQLTEAFELSPRNDRLYQTPPSNRKGRVLEDEATSSYLRRLRNVRSNLSDRTNKTQDSMKKSGLKRGKRTSRSADRNGFRTTALEIDIVNPHSRQANSLAMRLEAGQRSASRLAASQYAETLENLDYIPNRSYVGTTVQEQRVNVTPVPPNMRFEKKRSLENWRLTPALEKAAGWIRPKKTDGELRGRDAEEQLPYRGRRSQEGKDKGFWI